MGAQAEIDVDALFTLDELCRACVVSPEWVHQRVREGLLELVVEEPAGWRFDAVLVRRVRRMRRIERDFDAGPELAALVADLQDEVEALRRRLHQAGIDRS